jgi:hypothetical protein
MADTVKVFLDGELVELVPTRFALEKLSNKYQNMNAVIEQLISHSFSVMTDIIFFGTGGKADLEKTKDAVFDAGVVNLLQPLTDYIMILMNNGKKPNPEVGGSTNPEA